MYTITFIYTNKTYGIVTGVSPEVLIDFEDWFDNANPDSVLTIEAKDNKKKFKEKMF